MKSHVTFAGRKGTFAQMCLDRLAGPRHSLRLARGQKVVAYGLLLISWIFVRLQPILASTPFETPDTLGYRKVAGYSLDSLYFFIGIRPFSVPLLLKLARSDAAFVAIQATIGFLCWGFLAFVFARAISDWRIRFGACAVVLGFSASEPIARWDFLLMSESLSLSLLALFVACWITLLTDWRWWKVSLLLLTALLWGFTRDTNAYVLAMCGAVVIPFALLRRLRLHYLSIAAALVILFVAINMTAELSSRWVFPFLNVVTTRILPDAELTAVMAQQGMPVSPDLFRFTGKRAYGENYGLYTEPALVGFRKWLYAGGKGGYMRFLLLHPRWAFAEPLRERDNILGLAGEDDGFPRSTTLAQGWVGASVYAAQPWTFTGSFVVAILLAGVALWRAGWSGLTIWAVPLCLLLFAWPLGMIAWHGDSMDVARHALQSGVQARLGILFLAFLAIDRLVGRGDSGRSLVRG